MKPRIVGITGLARSGKDTVTNLILKVGGYYRVSLADELKKEIAQIFPTVEYPFDWLNVAFRDNGEIYYPNDTKDPEKLAIRRRLWQLWGTEGRRALFSDFWIWRWAGRAMKALVAGWPGVVVADVRFLNEAKYIHDLGGMIVATDRGDYRAPGVDYTHASEREIPEIVRQYASIVVPNKGTYEEFVFEVEKCSSIILGEQTSMRFPAAS
jgi:hypothetical protein